MFRNSGFGSSYLVAILFVIFGSVLLGCGQNGSTTAAQTYASSSCSSGYVFSSSYGCLLQSTCGSGYGLYNGSCVLVGATTATSGCIAITQSIPFFGSNLQLDAGSGIRGGVIPSVGTYGSLAVGSTATSGGTGFTAIAGSSGTFQLYVQSYTGSTSGTVAISGSLTIGSYYQQEIQSLLATSGYGASTYGTSPCISGIAIQGHLYTNGSYGYGGDVYLYLNGTQHGVVLTF